MTGQVRGGPAAVRWRVDADPRRAAAWAFFLSVAATLALAWLYHRRNEDQSIRAFEAQAVEAAERVVERLRLYEYGLRGARSFVLGVGDGVTRAKFQMYYESRDLGREFPGARGFGFIRRVPAGREAAFVAEVREGGIPDFSVHQLAPWSGDRYVVQYIEPLTRNRAALGFDIASEPVRREAADMAVRTGRVAITRPLTLVQARDERYSGFLVLLPVYRPDAPLGTEFERRAATIGWSYAPLVLAEVLAGLDLHAGALTIALDDADGLSGPFTRFHGVEAAGEAPLVRSFVRPVFGRAWRIEVRAEPAFFAGLHLLSTAIVLGIGGVISALLAALIYAYRVGDQRRRQIVADGMRLATIVENSSDAIVAETLDGIVTGWNYAAERIFGVRVYEAVGRAVDEVAVPVGCPARAPSILVSLGSGTAVTPFEQVFRRRDGGVVEALVSIAPITAPDGRVIGVGKTIRDISAEKAAERRLRAFNDRLELEVAQRTSELETARRDLQTLLDSLPSWIGYWDAALICRFANRAYWEGFGLGKEEIAGRHIREVLPEPLYAQNRGFIEAAQRGEPQSFERDLPPIDGRPRHVLVHYIPDVVAGEVRGFYVLAHDVTELHEGRQRLAEAMRAAEAANAAKSEFLANMSHEIRTPLHAILGLTHLVERSTLDDEQRRFVTSIKAAGHSLLGIVNDVLDLAKIEAGGLTLERGPFDLGGAVAELAALFEPQARAKQIELTLDVAPDLPGLLAGDVVRVRQVLLNLLGNAIKFTERGSVRVQVAVLTRTEAEIRAALVVRDTGVGIDADAQARLFAPFTQADASTTRRYGGTGLGLSIVRRLVELMGGTIALRSEAGGGSEFTVELPLGAVDAAAAGLGAARPGADGEEGQRLVGVRALVVDDNEINCEVARRILECEGAAVTIGADGVEALERVRAAPDGFDVVLMDVQMPNMDGNEATARIRAELGLASLPVIAVTAGALVVERRRSLDAGVTDFVSKPLVPDDLIRTVVRHVRARA